MYFDLTASGEISISTVYFGKPLKQFVLELNKNLSKDNKLKVINNKPGKYGFDILATMINNIIKCLIDDPTDITLFMRNQLDITQYTTILHGSWIGTYLVWKNLKPWLTNDSFIKPTKKYLQSEINDNIATTYFNNLPPELQNSYFEVFNILLTDISNIIVNNSMQNLQM